MSYISFLFGFFLLICAIVYYHVPMHWRSRVLLCASLVFYVWFDIRGLVYLLFVAGSTYLTATHVQRNGRSKGLLVLCIAANVTLWFVLKELPWLANGIASATGKKMTGVWKTVTSLMVPVGISYYMLSAISYVADVWKRKILPEKSFEKYLLYLSYFPAVVQGPICRYSELAPQLCYEGSFDTKQYPYHLLRILIGLVKKMVVADRLAAFVNYCFSNYGELSGVVLYLGAIAFAFQLYMDFSGCVDLCRGVSGIFGIELVENFNAPYWSQSIKEFWQRWHLSFSHWLRDYVYIPLGGNRKGIVRKYLNILAVFFVSGIWHGAGFNYILWGCMQAVFQIVGEGTRNIRARIKEKLGIEEGSLSEKIYRVLITFHLTLLSWIVFRADSIRGAMRYIWNMLIPSDLWQLHYEGFYTHGITHLGFLLVGMHIIVFMLMDYRRLRQVDPVKNMSKLHGILRWIVYGVLIADIALFGVYGKGVDLSGFLYGGY